MSPSPSKNPVVITGMHRSGTSLLANLLQAAGVSVGKRLMEATEFNAKGYFEDLDFQELHESIIDASHHGFLHRDLPGKSLAITEQHLTTAKRLLDSRKDQGLWGWKDPRSTLFLEMWAELLPDAAFVFIFRDPVQVVDSLRRRRDPELMWNIPGLSLLEPLGLNRFRTKRAIHMWCYYNRQVVAFLRSHPERSVLVNAAELVPCFPPLMQRLTEDWGMPLEAVDPLTVYDPTLMQAKGPEDLAKSCAEIPEVADLYQQLKSLSISHP